MCFPPSITGFSEEKNSIYYDNEAALKTSVLRDDTLKNAGFAGLWSAPANRRFVGGKLHRNRGKQVVFEVPHIKGHCQKLKFQQ